MLHPSSPTVALFRGSEDDSPWGALRCQEKRRTRGWGRSGHQAASRGRSRRLRAEVPERGRSGHEGHPLGGGPERGRSGHEGSPLGGDPGTGTFRPRGGILWEEARNGDVPATGARGRASCGTERPDAMGGKVPGFLWQSGLSVRDIDPHGESAGEARLSGRRFVFLGPLVWRCPAGSDAPSAGMVLFPMRVDLWFPRALEM